MKKKRDQDTKKPQFLSSKHLKLDPSFFRQEMKSLKECYEAKQYGALCDIVYICYRFHEPIPVWAVDGIISLLKESLNHKRVSSKMSWMQRHKQDLYDQARFEMVEFLLDYAVPQGKPTGRDDQDTDHAFHLAHLLLRNAPAAGTSHMMRESWRTYKKRAAKDPLRYRRYFSIEWPYWLNVPAIHQDEIEIYRKVVDICKKRLPKKMIKNKK